MKSGFSGASTASLMLAGLFWLGGCSLVARAQAPASLPSAPTTNPAVYLDYRELGYSAATFGLTPAFQAAPFKKEPDLGGRSVTRGVFKFGNSSEQFVPFILDAAQARLYLDLNRNQDLTDDPNGVFTSAEKPANAYYHSYRKIPLTFKTPEGMQKALVDIGIYSYGNPVTVQVECRYCWEGKVVFQGRDYQLALVDQLSGKLGSPEGGFLALRPWADRDQPLSVQSGSLEGFPFTRDLFFAGQSYRLDWSLLQQDGGLRYRVSVNPRAAELGDLKLTGQHIHRLLLTRDGNPSLTVVLDSPNPLEQVPRGVYHYDLTLKAGAAEAHPVKAWGPAANPRVSVAGTNAAILAAGGPLTNTVTANRNGKNLALNYRLVGADGQAYELQGQRKEPQWAVLRAGKQIDSGQFQFG